MSSCREYSASYDRSMSIQHGASSRDKMRSLFEIRPGTSAINDLIKTLSSAKLKRMFERLCSPRRLLLTSIAVALLLVWLGQAIAGVLFRESASKSDLIHWIAVSLLTYCGWNFLKIAGRKPQEPFEWTDTERELLIGAPIARIDVIYFRWATIARSSLVKALIFSLVMIPDFALLPVGFLGILAALMLIECFRMAAEIVIYGMRQTELYLFRALLFGCVGIVLVRAVALAYCEVAAMDLYSASASFSFLSRVFTACIEQSNLWYGVVAISPWQQLAEMMTAERVTLLLVLQFIAVGVLLANAVNVLAWLERFFSGRRLAVDRAKFSQLQTSEQIIRPQAELQSPTRSLFLMIEGWGALIWRQWRGAAVYRYSILVAVLIPAILTILSPFRGESELSVIANATGTLAFYTMVLLPSTLRFDFRRDLDRLNILKSLPISTSKICLGQLVVPVSIAWAFQVGTLVLVAAVSSCHPVMVAVAAAILIPFNVLVFCFENLVFLWYPYRANQEGVQVLFRSILAFTAKSVLLSLGLLVTIGWVFGSRMIVDTLAFESAWFNVSTVFAGGSLVAVLGMAIASFAILARTFERFDISSDLSGLD